MKKTLIFLLLVSMIYSCNKKDSTIVIKGKLVHSSQTYIYLQELLVNGLGKADSIKLTESGRFKFKRVIAYPCYFSLKVGKSKPITILAMPSERIIISGSALNLFETYSVKGSDESLNCQTLTRHLAQTQKSLDSLNQVFQKYKTNPNINNIRNMLSGMYDGVLKKEKTFVTGFIGKNTKSFSSILALYEQFEPNVFVLSDAADFKYFESVEIALFKAYPQAPYVQTLHSNVEEMREQQRLQKLKLMFSDLGAVAPDIALPSPKGDTIRLSSTRGKIVLVDFWASWCNPCREENPNLVLMYNRFKSKGFEIFQVSLDKTRDAWMKAIKDDHLNWMQGSDLSYWDSKVAKNYNVEALPASFLLDRDGKIIAKGLKGPELENKLIQLLEK